MPVEARLSPTEHSKHGWRVAEIAPDFTLIDAWALPASGTLEEFSDLCHLVLTLEPGADEDSPVSNALFALRGRLGVWFGWDGSGDTLPIPGCAETSLKARLPDDLKQESETAVAAARFRPVFHTPTEWASEVSNSTVHAILHLGWVDQRNGTYAGQLGVYVKTRGQFGPFYMALIGPFRHRIIYPALMRRIGKLWRARVRSADSQ